MARTADHEQRRRQVAEALLRAVGEQGPARTTLADVADHAGVSIGLVQSYRSYPRVLRTSGQRRIGSEPPPGPQAGRCRPSMSWRTTPNGAPPTAPAKHAP
nr:TetR family transcriptional regulator [Nocardiopsis sp. TSRI0078]